MRGTPRRDQAVAEGGHESIRLAAGFRDDLEIDLRQVDDGAVGAFQNEAARRDRTRQGEGHPRTAAVDGKFGRGGDRRLLSLQRRGRRRETRRREDHRSGENDRLRQSVDRDPHAALGDNSAPESADLVKAG
jgi:hypothetical protein